MLREELADRFGPIPDPLDNLIRLQDARIKLGRAGARSVDFRGGRLSVAPDRARLARLEGPARADPGGASTSRAARTVRVRLPEEPTERFRAVVAAAEAILEVATEP